MVESRRVCLERSIQGTKLTIANFPEDSLVIILLGLILLPSFNFPQKFSFAQTQLETTVYEGHIVSTSWPEFRLENVETESEVSKNFYLAFLIIMSHTPSVRKQCRDSIIYYFYLLYILQLRNYGKH